MKLYHHPFSSSTRRVTVTANALGLAEQIEHVPVDLANQADRDALVAVNPNKKIPVLVDGDLVLWESHAIMQYLCSQQQEQTLYPVAPRLRADVDRWLHWISSHLAPAVGPLSFEKLWKKFVTGGEPDPVIVARYEGMFRITTGVLDAHLATRRWLANDQLSLADLSLAATLMYSARTELPLADFPHVQALLARVHDLPAWRATEPARVP